MVRAKPVASAFIPTVLALTAGLTVDRADMGSDSGGEGIGLPDVHFCAASPVVPLGLGLGVRARLQARHRRRPR